MDKNRAIELATELGWKIVNIGDKVIKGIRTSGFAAVNSFEVTQTFVSEDEAWDYVIARIRGGADSGVDVEHSLVTGQRGAWLSEMMAYVHPSTAILSKRQGNIYACTQRKMGNAPSFYTMSLGVEMAARVLDKIVVEYRTFHVPFQGFDAVALEDATRKLYEQFTAWKVEYVDVELLPTNSR